MISSPYLTILLNTVKYTMLLSYNRNLLMYSKIYICFCTKKTDFIYTLFAIKDTNLTIFYSIIVIK